MSPSDLDVGFSNGRMMRMWWGYLLLTGIPLNLAAEGQNVQALGTQVEEVEATEMCVTSAAKRAIGQMLVLAVALSHRRKPRVSEESQRTTRPMRVSSVDRKVISVMFVPMVEAAAAKRTRVEYNAINVENQAILLMLVQVEVVAVQPRPDVPLPPQGGKEDVQEVEVVPEVEVLGRRRNQNLWMILTMTWTGDILFWSLTLLCCFTLVYWIS